MDERNISVEEAIAHLVNILKEEGSILFAQVPGRLNPFDYKQHSGKQGLKNWLLSFPEFVQSEDGLSLELASPVAPAQQEEDDSAYSVWEARCMHAFAYMNYWNQNLKQLRSLGDFADLKVDSLRDRIAHTLMHDIFAGELSIDLSDAEAPRLFLNTDLTLPGGHPVYAVLVPNPANKDGSKQFWMMKGFGSPAEEDASELGRWLRSYFGTTAPLDYEELCRQMDTVAATMTTLQGEIAEFLTALNAETCPSLAAGSRLSQKIADYEQQWQALLDSVEGFAPIGQECVVTLSQLRTATSQESLRTGLLSQALDAFDAMAQGLQQFFSECHWNSETPHQDSLRLRSFYGSTADPNLSEFRNLLIPYRCVRDAMASQQADDAHYDRLDAVKAHFKDLPHIRNVARILIDIPQEERMFLEDIEKIDQLLAQYQASQAVVPSPEEEVLLPQNHSDLLAAALSGDVDYQRNWPSYLKAALPEDTALQALVISEDPMAELTCFAAATRLLEAGEESHGERYLILGLEHEFVRCAPELAKLYRENHRVADFEAVWNQFHEQEDVKFSDEDEFFRFAAICIHSPEQALTMARANMKLQYQPAYLTHLIPAAEALGDGQLAETFRSRLSRMGAAQEPDAFETAVISGDPAAIMEAAREESLQALGFSERQIKSICSTAESGEYPTGSDAYEVGCRLFRFQGNRHTLAEQWMWQGISKQARLSYGELLCLLTIEHRWEEVIALYEANAEIQKRFEVSRRFYLIARFRNSYLEAQPAFSENLQDILVLMKLQEEYLTEFSGIAQQPDHAFYGALCKLYHAVTHPYLWSVVCEDRSLREWVNDQEQMAQLGLNAARISEIYRSGKYPHGTDAQGICARLYALAGNFNGAAEAAALLAPEDSSADLLWPIYSDEQNESAMYDLLVRHPRLRQEHHQEYLNFLYTRGEYAAFLDTLSPDDDFCDRQILQRATAQLHIGRPLSDSHEVCAEAARNESPELCLPLLTVAGKQENADLVASILCACFEHWICLESQQLAELVSCGHFAGKALLESVQVTALAEGAVSLAVYLQNHFQIGNIPEQAQQLYLQLQEELEGSNMESWQTCIRKLQCLYPDQEEILSARSVSISIQTLLQDIDPAHRKDNAEHLHTILQALGDESALFDTVAELLTASEYCWDYRVYTALYDYGQRVGRLTDVLLLLHSASGIPGAEKKPYFRDYLIKFYYNALSQETFPIQIAKEAEEICFQAVGQSESPLAAVCIYILEQLSQRPIYAAAVLNHLVLSRDSLSASPRQALEQLDIADLPAHFAPSEIADTGLDLFEKLLDEGTEAQILEYLQFCNRFVHVDTGVFQELRNLCADRHHILSEQQSILAIDLLCTAPENEDYWEICSHISFGTSDAGRIRFLHLCCEKCPNHWGDYVKLCEAQSDAPVLLAPALVSWASVPGIHEQKCRQHIEDRLEDDPDYLSRLPDGNSLCQLVTCLCRRLKDSSESWNHAQIGTVARIAVGTGLPECLKILLRDADHLLLGSKADLGVVVVSRLLLADRIEEAMLWISYLHESLAVIKYRSLIEELCLLDETQLQAWCAQQSNRDFLCLMLPDGNQPNVDQVTSLAASALLNGTAKETASILASLLRIFPDDHVTSYALMELCRAEFEGSLPLLHASLVNLMRLPEPPDKTRIFYDRLHESHATALAILNQLLIYKKQMKQIGDDWDFRLSTAQNLENIGTSFHNHDLLDRTEQAVRDSLINQPPEIFTLRLQAWMANITGNWTDYLRSAFDAHQPTNEVFFPADKVSSGGFARSILRLFSQVDPAERPRLRTWLSKLPLDSHSRKQQRKTALYLEEEGILHQFLELEGVDADAILRFPGENFGLYQKFAKSSLTNILDKGTAYAGPTAHIVCASAGIRTVMGEMRTRAANYFDNGQDDMAWCLYSALYNIACNLQVSHAVVCIGKNVIFSVNLEEYQSRARVAGAFSGQSAELKKLKDSNLNPWTTVNLVLSLAIDKATRIDEIQRLIKLLSPARAALAEKVLLLLTDTLSDEKKLSIIEDTSIPDEDRYYLAKVLKHPYEPKHMSMERKPAPLLLKDAESALKAFQIYQNLHNQHNGAPGAKRFSYCLTLQEVNRDNISRKITQQLDPSQWTMVETVSNETGLYVYVAPPYAAVLTPIPGTQEELDACWEEYGQLLLSSPHGRFADKATLSQEIYCRTLGFDKNDAWRYRAMLRLSIDRFHLLLSEGSMATAVEILIPLLEADSSGIPSCAETIALADMFNTVGASSLLKSYGDIRSMVQSYADHKSAFLKMKGLLRDSITVQNIDVIYKALDNLSEQYALANAMGTDHLIKGLEDADRLIGSISGIGWLDARGQLQRLIRSERNLLSRRPILEIKLLNRDNQPAQGCLQGIITNKGTVAAEQLTLQAFCGDLNGSGQYTLDRILPGGKAIFEIPYSVSADAEALTGYLELSVNAANNGNISQRLEFLLPLGETSGESLLYNTYSTDKAGHFVYDPDAGIVKNEQFFGRSVETAQMRELVAGTQFSDYHSAVVYGVRRTGKTSLLEYFRTYVRGSRPDCLCIRIDVQSTDTTIQSVFVNSVLKEETVQAALEASGDREAFAAAWERPSQSQEELNPSLLKTFFQELKKITGKGLILIIDEIDRLFKRLIDDHMESTLNALLKTISGILDDADSQEYLHLVICGSNWLMYYAGMGRDMQEMQQVFHRLGDYKISVGRLPKEDVMDLLLSAPVNYTEEALEMIWEYTGGLVWFVKLFGNAAIRRAKSQNRAWIYPADVFYSLYEVLCDRNCEQFYEGCTPGGLERPLIDVMQAMACRKDMYLSMDKICEKLGRDPDDVERAMAGLIRFEIALRDPVNPDMVRFSLDIYRRYFRTVNSSQVREPEEPAVFERKIHSSIAQTSYSDDELI